MVPAKRSVNKLKPILQTIYTGHCNSITCIKNYIIIYLTLYWQYVKSVEVFCK